MYGIPKRKKAADGGLIVGPGTGTSDSIEKTVPAGSYILPADTTEKLGFGLPGYNGNPKMPKKEQPRLGWPSKSKQVPVAVSNGEMELPPEQVHAVGAAVLDQVKDATHQPKGFGLSREVLAAAKGGRAEAPRQFFADGGLVDDEKRPGGFGFPGRTTGTVQREEPRLGLPRSGQRPATEQPRLGLPGAARETAQRSGLLDVPLGIGQAAAGALRVPVAAGQDALRNVAAYATGADPDQLPGGATRFRDEAVGQFQSGLERVGDGVSGLQQSGRRALGIQPQQEVAASPAADEPRLGIPRPRATQPEQPRLGLPGPAREVWARANGGIAARVGADGVPEFSNDPAAVAGAGDMPAGGVARVGDGVGGRLSVGDPGDAEAAIARFQRANDIRQQTLAENRGTVTGLTDNRGRPTLEDRQRAQLDLAQAQAEGLRERTQQDSALTGQQLAAESQRMGTEQLNQQRLQQQIAEGDLGMQDRQRLEQLRAQIADPNLSEEERNVARQAYNVLATQAKDRYIAQDVVMGQGNNGPVIGRQIIDVTTGQPVAGGGDQLFGLPQGVTRDRAISEARAAIEAGIPREAVNERLRQWGIDPV